MFVHDAPPHFTERARQSWRTLGYAGMAFPFLTNIHAAEPVVVLTTTAFFIPSIWNLVASQRERLGDKLPALIANHDQREERRELGTLTFRRLLDKWKAELPTEDLITEAASCSNDFGRKICVIYVRIPGLPAVTRDYLAYLLRENVRSTDDVSIFSEDEFIVCAPLLRDALAAEVICKRLMNAIRGADLYSASLEIHLGKAVYPMDGYTGADLIRHARIVSRLVW